MSLLDIKDLSHSFGEKQLFKEAEFQLNKGEHNDLRFFKICFPVSLYKRGANEPAVFKSSGQRSIERRIEKIHGHRTSCIS